MKFITRITAIILIVFGCATGVMTYAQGTPSVPAETPCTLHAPDPNKPLVPPCLRPDNIPTFANNVLVSGAGENIKIIISFIAGGIATLSGILAVVFIMYHGLILTISGGDEGKRGDSIKKIQWAVFGLIGVIFAYVIVNVVLDVVTTVGTAPRTEERTSDPNTINTVTGSLTAPDPAISGERSIQGTQRVDGMTTRFPEASDAPAGARPEDIK